MQGRWLELENLILDNVRNKNNFEVALTYTRDIIKGKWRELESLLSDKDQNFYDYKQITEEY